MKLNVDRHYCILSLNIGIAVLTELSDLHVLLMTPMTLALSGQTRGCKIQVWHSRVTDFISSETILTYSSWMKHSIAITAMPQLNVIPRNPPCLLSSSMLALASKLTCMIWFDLFFTPLKINTLTKFPKRRQSWADCLLRKKTWLKHNFLWMEHRISWMEHKITLARKMRFSRAMKPAPRKSEEGSLCCHPISVHFSCFKALHASPGNAKPHNSFSPSWCARSSLSNRICIRRCKTSRRCLCKHWQ